MIFNIKFSIIFTSKFLLYFYICLDKQKQITMSINKVSIVGIKGFKVICLKNSFCVEIFLLNILPVKKIGCIFAHNKRTFKKHFPFFGIVY